MVNPLPSNAGGAGSVPSQGTKIPHAMWLGQNNYIKLKNENVRILNPVALSIQTDISECNEDSGEIGEYMPCPKGSVAPHLQYVVARHTHTRLSVARVSKCFFFFFKLEIRIFNIHK